MMRDDGDAHTENQNQWQDRRKKIHRQTWRSSRLRTSV